MDIVTILVVLVVAGLAVYLVNQFDPIPRPFKIAINVVIVLVLIVWLLQAVGLISGHLFHLRGR